MQSTGKQQKSFVGFPFPIGLLRSFCASPFGQSICARLLAAGIFNIKLSLNARGIIKHHLKIIYLH